MFRRLFCAMFVSAVAASGAVAQGEPWINVEDEKGIAVMGFRTMTNLTPPASITGCSNGS